MRKPVFLKALFCTFFILGCVLPSMAAKATSEEYHIPDGRDISYMLNNPDFSLYTFPEGLSPSNIADEILPGGILVYFYEDPTDGSTLYGLLDSDGSVLLQPRYTEIKTLNISYLLEEYMEELDTSFPNLLVLSDEANKSFLFDCRTKELLDGSYDKIGIDESSLFFRYDTCSIFEYFIPVYIEGDGYGMLNLEGELIIPCQYDSYVPKHSLRMSMCKNDPENRVATEHLYSENGELLNSYCQTLDIYHNGMVAAQKASLTDPTGHTYGYLDFYGNWVFTLGEEYDIFSGEADSWANWFLYGTQACDFSAEGLVQVDYYDEERDTVYPVFLSNLGEIAFSLSWVYDEVLLDLSWPYEGELHVSEFHDGMALISVDIYRDITVYDHSVQYLLYSDGTHKKLSSDIYYVEKNGILLAKESKDATEYFNVIGAWGFHVLSGNDYIVDFCCDSDNCKWLEITDSDTNLSAYLSLAEWRISDFLYTPSSGSCNNYLGEVFLKVSRDGNRGVLGPNAEEFVPCEYSHVSGPGDFTAYFYAYSESGYYTLYSLDGDLISEHEQLANFYFHDYRYGAVSGAIARDRNSWTPALIDNAGNITLANDQGYYSIESAFTCGLAYALCSYSNGDEWVTEPGFLTEDGSFKSLSYVGHEFCDNFSIGSDPELPYGVCALTHEHRDSEDGLPYMEYYLLRCNSYTFTGWHETDTSVDASPLVEVVSVTPTNGAVDVHENIRSVDIKFNQDILLQSKDLVTINCPLNTPKYYLSCSGDTLHIVFPEPLEVGEPYTIVLDPLAVMSARSQISYFEGFTSTFKVFGLSTEELLTKYPQYLNTPTDIEIKTDIALCAANNAMDRYAGDNNISAFLASLFYSTQNYHTIIGYEMMEEFGGGGFDSTLWNDVLQTFISQACLENEHKYNQLNQITKADLKAFICMFNLEGTQKEVVDQLRSFAEDANFNISDSELDAIAEGMKKLALQPEFLELYLGITEEFANVAGEFAASFLTYYYINRDTAETLLRYLPESSELYRGLKAHIDALTNGDTLLFLLTRLGDDSFSSFLKIGMKQLGKYHSEIMGSAAALKSVNICTDVAYIMYTAVSPRAEITQYIKSIMFSSYVFSLDAALDDLRVQMMSSASEHGTTTSQQREDFKELYRTYQSVWMMFLDHTSALFKEDGNYFYAECMTAKAILEEECDYESFLRSCRKAVPHNDVREILAQQSNADTTTVTGYLPSTSPSPAVSQTAISLLSGNSTASEQPSLYSDDYEIEIEDIRISSAEELMAWMNYSPETEEEYLKNLAVTGDIVISEPGSYAFPEVNQLVICEGASLTVGSGVTCSSDTYIIVSGSFINYGTFDMYSFIDILPSESGSSTHGSLYNHGTLNLHGDLYAETLTTVVNTGEFTVSGYCLIRGSFAGTDPTCIGTIVWPTRPYSVPDSYDALITRPTALVIPGELDSKGVSAVADGAFAEDPALRFVTVTGSTDGTFIGSGAFRNCTELRYVTLGNVIDIGEYAFSDCAIEAVVIPASVTGIGTGAFNGVRVIFGYTSVAQAHAASINAAYVDISKTLTELEITSPPVNTVFTAGEEPDLSGLVLTSGGNVVSLTDCCIEALPASPGNHLLHIQYLDACVTLPIEIKCTTASGSEALELLSVEQTGAQTVLITGTVSSAADDPVVIAAFYQANGQLIGTATPILDKSGSFHVEYPAAGADNLHIFLLDKGRDYLPLTPALKHQLP